MVTILLIVIVVLLSFYIASKIDEAMDASDWNNGTCYYCLTKWEHIDTDSKGNKRYTCDCEKSFGENRDIWISKRG